MRAISCAIAFVLFSSVTAWAQSTGTWLVAVNKVENRFLSLFFVDTDRIQVRGDVRRTWIRLVFSPSNPRTTAREIATLSDYNCRDRSSIIIQSTEYERDGTTQALPLTNTTHYVVPDSFDESILTFVCATPMERTQNNQWFDLQGVPYERIAETMFAQH